MSDEEKIAIRVDGQEELSPEETARQMEARRMILERTARTQNAEKQLASALEQAQRILSESAWKRLETLQTSWQRSGRGQEVNALVQEGFESTAAFAKATEMRANWIRLHAHWGMLLESGHLFACPQNHAILEVYDFGERVNLTVRSLGKNATILTLSGAWHGDEAELQSEVDRAILMRVTKRENALELAWAGSIENSVGVQIAPSFAGIYTRLEVTETDVFTL